MKDSQLSYLSIMTKEKAFPKKMIRSNFICLYVYRFVEDLKLVRSVKGFPSDLLLSKITAVFLILLLKNSQPRNSVR